MTTTIQASAPILSAAQVARFHREGFLALDAITTPEDVARIRELLDALFDRFDELPKDLALDLGDVKTHSGKQKTPQINMASRFEPRLRDTLYFRNAESVARQLLGGCVMPSWDHAILKPPHNGSATPWHQDLSYPAHSSGNWDIVRLGCNFWMPLQDASVESGCMQFIPHSHLGNLRPHHPVGHDPRVHTLETDGVDASKAVACPIPAGGCTIHMPKTLHYTAPNDTDEPRRTYILFFGAEL